MANWRWLHLLFLVLPMLLIAQQSESGQKWALCIGISKFEDKRIAELPRCAAGAQAIANYFANDGVAAANIKLLADHKATTANFMATLLQIKENSRASDTVFLFYSGYLATDDTGAVYLVTYDTSKTGLAQNAIPLLTLKQLLQEGLHCQNVVVLVDTCHAGDQQSFQEAMPLMEELHKLTESTAAPTRIAVLTACRTHEYSQAAVESQQTAFVAALLQGLSGEADSLLADGQVSVTELFNHAVTTVPRMTNRAQHPWASMSAGWPTNEAEAVVFGKMSPQRDTATAQRLVERKVAEAEAPLTMDRSTDKPKDQTNADKPKEQAKEPAEIVAIKPDKEAVEVMAESRIGSKYNVLIVANQDYRDEEQWGDLTTPLTNAKAITTILTNVYGIPKGDITLLKNGSKKQMLQAFATLAENAEPQDQVLIVYLGHGHSADGKSYLVPVDGKEGNLAKSLIPVTALAKSLHDIKARRVLLISEVALGLNLITVETTAKSNKQSGRSCQVLMAGNRDYQDETYKNKLSAFSYFVTESIKKQPSCTSAQLAGRLKKALKAAGENAPKFGVLFGNGKPFALVKAKSAASAEED